jgi:hypothetical protein
VARRMELFHIARARREISVHDAQYAQCGLAVNSARSARASGDQVTLFFAMMNPGYRAGRPNSRRMSSCEMPWPRSSEARA